MNISIRQLEVFCAIAHHNHVGRAAVDVSISQSAASMALAELERQLGERLFDRFGKKLALNDSGKSLLPKAMDLLARAGEIETYFHRTESCPTELKVGASSTIGNYLMPLVLASFATEQPGVRIALQVDNTQQMIESLLDCRNDLAFIEGPCSEPDIETRPWRDDELIIFASPRHPLAALKEIIPSDLASAPWVLREKGSGTRTVFERAMAGIRADLKVSYELGHSESIKRAVKHDLGISCLSRLIVQEDLDNGTLVQLATPFLALHRHLHLLLRRDKYQTRALKLFLDFLQPPAG